MPGVPSGKCAHPTASVASQLENTPSRKIVRDFGNASPKEFPSTACFREKS
jgi:hypothetical protein